MLRNSKYLCNLDSNYVPVKLNLGKFLVQRLKKYEDNVAMINGDTDERYTFDQILQSSMNIAVSLVKFGVRKGDVIGICAESLQEYWATVVGITCAEAVMTPLNIGYVKDELKHVMNISKPKYLFCSMQAYEKHKAVFTSLDFIERIIMFGDEKVGDCLLYKDLATVTPNSFITSNINFEDFEAVDVEGHSHTVFLMYSSGTSGLSKAVMQTHLNVITVLCSPEFVDPELSVLNITPWYHAFGLMTNLIYLCNGVEILYLTKFEVCSYLRSIEKYKVNQLVLVPPVVTALVKTSENYDLSSVVTILCAAAVLDPRLIDAVKVKFKNLKAVIQAYGLTETTFTITMDTYFTNKRWKMGSVGKVISNTFIKISDLETREPLEANKLGEICIKGPTVMKGYLQQVTPDLYEDGFLKSGDIGYYDEEGYLYIVERSKELIKYKAYQVPPAEVEAVLLQHVGVRDAGVVGLPNTEAGELPLAFVVPQPGATLTESELQQFVAERLSNPKRLRGGVRFIEEIPKTASGKILRKLLRELIMKKIDDSV